MLKKLIQDWRWTTAAWLTVVLPIMAIEWIVFKCCYPYADFFTDSYSYIQAAAQGDLISFRPIGYSVFLRLVRVFTSSDTVLVTLQYALVQGATLGLVLSLRRWCGLKERPVGVLMAFVLLNPVIPYVCNYVSSDALFIGLSLIWLTVLMGILREPAWWRIWLQVGLLFAILNTRYVALYYPAVAALTVLLTKRGAGFKIWGVALSVGVVVAGTLGIKEITKRETGADLFSAFSGWQIANNVLNLYEHIPVDTAGLPSPECQELAGYVQRYFQAGRRQADTGQHMIGAAEVDETSSVTTMYMWARTSPLHQYMKAYKQQNKLSYFTAWNRVGVVFSQYGYFVVRRHPFAFLRYYGWPSTKTFFLPGLDVFAVYNEGHTEVDEVAKNWFHYPTLRPKVVSATIQARLLAPMPWIALLLNLSFIVVAALLLPSRALRLRDPVFTGSYELVSAFLLANACFCIFASPSVFRYQVLPMILLFVFTVSGISKSRIFFVPS
ncbi:hypothetical protein [Puia dinghuensis]|uniref:Uncharacterized protein n=1 Tax=Puia dinghuensis TaxID=1792502 RepID=A0A8J2XT33_9BACT|nr:hypothetical protein [Puia dinghuensis]GGA95601.1 hypothetical protein GCM10011511_18670 [Puia dinghuensis]